MPVLYLWNRILCVVLFGFSTSSSDSGPFKSNVIYVNKCEEPSHQYVNDTSIILSIVAQNTTTDIILKGTVNVVRDTKITKFRIKSYIWENNKWNMNYLMNDINCRSILFRMFCKAANINYDSKSCTILKGQYKFENVNPNSLQHIWTARMEYGKLLWKFEIMNPKQRVITCTEFLTVTEPI